MNQSQLDLILEDLGDIEKQFYRVLKEGRWATDREKQRRELLQFDGPYERIRKRIKLEAEEARDATTK